MATKRNLKPKEPGTQTDFEDEVVENETNESEELEVSNGDDLEPVFNPVDEEPISMSKRELAELVAGMVDAQVESRVMAEVKAARRRSELSQTRGATEQVRLPEQHEVDPHKINRAVLTKDGWVCPVVHPTDRNRNNVIK